MQGLDGHHCRPFLFAWYTAVNGNISAATTYVANVGTAKSSIGAVTLDVKWEESNQKAGEEEAWTQISTLTGVQLSDTEGKQWAINGKNKYVLATDVDSKVDNRKIRMTLSVPEGKEEDIKSYAGSYTITITSPSRVRLNTSNAYGATNRQEDGTYKITSTLTIAANGTLTGDVVSPIYVSIDGDPSGLNATPVAGNDAANDATETGLSITGNIGVSIA